MKKQYQSDKTDKISKSIIKIVGILLVFSFLSIAVLGGIMIFNLSPKNPGSKETITFKIEKGWGKSKIIDELENHGVIKSAFFFKIYTRILKQETFFAGTYELSASMEADKIIETIASGNSKENETINVTFVEGKKFPYYMKKIAESFAMDYDSIMQKTKDTNYLNTLIEKYWFLSNDILNQDIYYPLEGYLFPDTYTFKKTSTLEEILDKMLDEMGTKLKGYESDIKNRGMSIHSLLTLASMVELEAVTPKDRQIVAGVFQNRLNKNIAMGSDVTTYYAAKKEMTEKLLQIEIDGCNAYNTRGICAKTFPVGPICASSLTSIDAAIKPGKTDFLFFVADKNRKVYFSMSDIEQQRVIADLRSKNLWPE